METAIIRTVKNVDEAFSTTLRDIMNSGEELSAGISPSTGSGKKFKNLPNYSVVIKEPRQRLVWNPVRRINLIGAVARFVWMMAASNRLHDIRYYEEKVKYFSDDQILVPGSSYGARMINSEPGLNQIDGIIKRLKEDPSTRRAAIAIYQAEDAVRDSRDIPCTFGMFFQIRNGALHTAVQMRSNNAFILLPYNIFEFSLLSEAIAGELGVPLGTFHHSAWSMHVYEEDYYKAKNVIESEKEFESLEIPQMPNDPSPMEQINKLVRLEPRAREAASGFSYDERVFDTWLEAGVEDGLNSYWEQFYFILLLHMCQRNNYRNGVEKLKERIQSPWKEYLPNQLFTTDTNLTTQTKNSSSPFNPKPLKEGQEVQSGREVYNKELRKLEEHFDTLSKELARDNQAPISFTEYKILRNKLIGDLESGKAVAAREKKDYEVKAALLDLRKQSKRE